MKNQIKNQQKIGERESKKNGKESKKVNINVLVTHILECSTNGIFFCLEGFITNFHRTKKRNKKGNLTLIDTESER